MKNLGYFSILMGVIQISGFIAAGVVLQETAIALMGVIAAAWIFIGIQLLKQQELVTQWDQAFNKLNDNFLAVKESFKENIQEQRNLDKEFAKLAEKMGESEMDQLVDRLGVIEMALNIHKGKTVEIRSKRH